MSSSSAKGLILHFYSKPATALKPSVAGNVTDKNNENYLTSVRQG